MGKDRIQDSKTKLENVLKFRKLSVSRQALMVKFTLCRSSRISMSRWLESIWNMGWFLGWGRLGRGEYDKYNKESVHLLRKLYHFLTISYTLYKNLVID